MYESRLFRAAVPPNIVGTEEGWKSGLEKNYFDRTIQDFVKYLDCYSFKLVTVSKILLPIK